MPKKVEISHRTIIFTVLFLIGLFLVYEMRSIIFSLFVALILMSALNPAVDKISSYKIPRYIAIIFIYILLFAFIGLIASGVVPTLVSQTTVLINRFPFYLEAIGLSTVDTDFVQQQINEIGALSTNIFRFGLSVFTNILSVFAILILTFYLLMERQNLDNYLRVLFSENENEKAEKFVAKLEKYLGHWVRGELILMTIVGVFTYVGLLLLGIDFALPLAILAGLLEIIPNFGPTIASVPAIIAGFAISPIMGLAVAALYFLIQQMENSLLVPKIMQKAVGFNPLVTVIVLMIGFKLGGPIGALLSVPFFLTVKVVAEEFFNLGKLAK